MTQLSRADQILADWSAVARQVQRPAVPYGPATPTSAGVSPLGAGLVVVIALVIAVLWLLPQQPSRQGGVVTGSPSPEVRNATWWVDPAAVPLLADARVIPGFVSERACANGALPIGRVLPPTIVYRPDAVIVTFTIQMLATADCPTNPPYPVEVSLAEPLGGRLLLDGSDDLPRDATRDALQFPPPDIDCGVVPHADCVAVLIAAVTDPREVYQTIGVEQYAPACIRTRLCLPGWGGYGATHLVIATDDTGTRRGWKCTLESAVATCGVAPAEDVDELATLAIRFIGVGRQEISLRNGGTTWTRSISLVPWQQLLTVGRWTIASKAGCSVDFDAAPGGHYVAELTLGDQGPCRIELTQEGEVR